MSCLTKQKQEVLTSIETVCTLAMRSERQKNYSAHKYTDIVCHLYVLDEGKKKKKKKEKFHIGTETGDSLKHQIVPLQKLHT